MKGWPATQVQQAETPRLQWLGVWGSPAVMENHRIPTKPAGGLLPNIGKVAPALRWAGAPYWAALKLFYIPPWAFVICLLTGSNKGHYSDSKNWFTFGKIFLARPIVAQITKLNL